MSGKTILFIDDSELTRHYYKNQVSKKLGVHVEVANGLNWQEVLRKMPTAPDLVITDSRIDCETSHHRCIELGVNIATKLKENNAGAVFDTCHIPIIIASGGHLHDDEKLAAKYEDVILTSNTGLDCVDDNDDSIVAKNFRNLIEQLLNGQDAKGEKASIRKPLDYARKRIDQLNRTDPWGYTSDDNEYVRILKEKQEQADYGRQSSKRTLGR